MGYELGRELGEVEVRNLTSYITGCLGWQVLMHILLLNLWIRKDFVALTDCMDHGPRTKWVARQSEFLGYRTIHLCNTRIEF